MSVSRRGIIGLVFIGLVLAVVAASTSQAHALSMVGTSLYYHCAGVAHTYFHG
jgi:hypothetical protein